MKQLASDINLLSKSLQLKIQEWECNRQKLPKCCRSAEETFSSAPGSEVMWETSYLLLIIFASFFISGAADPSPKPVRRSVSTQTDALDDGADMMKQINNTTTDTTNTSLSSPSLIKTRVILAFACQALNLSLLILMGRNSAKIIETRGSSLYFPVIIQLVTAEFAIVISLASIFTAIERSQAAMKVPREQSNLAEPMKNSTFFAILVLIWPWYLLLSALSNS